MPPNSDAAPVLFLGQQWLRLLVMLLLLAAGPRWVHAQEIAVRINEIPASDTQLTNAFGGRDGYLAAIGEMETALYPEAT